MGGVDQVSECPECHGLTTSLPEVTDLIAPILSILETRIAHLEGVARDQDHRIGELETGTLMMERDISRLKSRAWIRGIREARGR